MTTSSFWALLGLVTVVWSPWSLISGWRGRWLWTPLGERTVFVAVCLLLAITLIDWSVRFFLVP